MEPGRETRFTAEVLEEAGRRLNRIKQALLNDDGLSAREVGAATVDELGWSIIGLTEMADEEFEQVSHVVPSGEQQVVTAFVDGVMLGGLAADIVYERSFGITGVTA